MTDTNRTPILKQLIIMVVGVVVLFAFWSPGALAAYSPKQRQHFQKTIVDYRHRLNPRYKRVKRRSTRYIIVHTSEGNLKSTLRTVSQGKKLHNGHRTYGGHAHYVIARNGRTYRTLDRRLRADHAGKSMWSGQTQISNTSIGIELVGYHYAAITSAQYRSVGLLIDILQRTYHLSDKAVLTHSQIAYGPPNRWFRKNHRGRKRCAKNFIRAKAGLGPGWAYDPDVRSGRLAADPQLAVIFYAKKSRYRPVHKSSRVTSKTRSKRTLAIQSSNVISKTNSAWAIAGEDYNSPTTVYKLPDGRVFRGDEVERKLGWNRILPKTVVLLNQHNVAAYSRQYGPVKTITDGLSAWVFAGAKYNHKTTIYFLPLGQIKNGKMISDWDDLPEKTKMIVGYRGPYKISKKHYPAHFAGAKFKDRNTLYYLPSKKFVAGDKIKNFNRIPLGTLIFVPVG